MNIEKDHLDLSFSSSVSCFHRPSSNQSLRQGESSAISHTLPDTCKGLKTIKVAPFAALATLNSDYSLGSFGLVFIFACGYEVFSCFFYQIPFEDLIKELCSDVCNTILLYSDHKYQ